MNIKKYPVTVHMLVKNEDRFVYYALISVAQFVERIIIYDTGSTDRTIELIYLFIKNHPNISIDFKEKRITSVSQIVELRKEQLSQTKTPWFLLVDGDEVWPTKELLKLLKLTYSLPKEKIAVVNQTREAVGDIWHYLPKSFGKYHLLGRTGHFNIRLMRNLNYIIAGEYPNEYYNYNGNSINQTDMCLAYSDAWYLHASHLIRTTSMLSKSYGRRKIIYSLGLELEKKDIPKVFLSEQSNIIPNVLIKRSAYFTVRSFVYDVLRKIKI